MACEAGSGDEGSDRDFEAKYETEYICVVVRLTLGSSACTLNSVVACDALARALGTGLCIRPSSDPVKWFWFLGLVPIFLSPGCAAELKLFLECVGGSGHSPSPVVQFGRIDLRSRGLLVVTCKFEAWLGREGKMTRKRKQVSCNTSLRKGTKIRADIESTTNRPSSTNERDCDGRRGRGRDDE